jgi:cytochrome bd-type quinol oxidase subunit 2
MSTDIELNNMETEITDNHLDVSKIVMKGPVLTEYNDDSMFLNFKKGLYLIISISSIFLYVVYSIIFLVVDKNESNKCDSMIWNYNLSLIILFFILIMLQYLLSKDKSNIIKKFFEILFGILWLGLGIFGIIIVRQEDCDKMKNTKLLEFTAVISIIITIFGSIMFLDGLGKLIYFYRLMNDK